MRKKLNKKYILVYIYGMLSTLVLGVAASSLYLASDIGYTPSDASWKVDTLEEAIDELYSETFSTRNSCKEQVAVPNLGNDGKLIPVTLENDGKVTYADTSKEWYNYCDKEWANAVILIDEPSKEYTVGERIFEEDIESYFVWIPKYKYKLWNTGTASKNAHSIEIVFDTKDTVDEEGVSCATPLDSGNIGNCNNGEYMTHPAFISMDVDGFWVGKFETGYKGATSSGNAQVSSSDDSKIIIKPNVYSWRTNKLNNFFVASYNYDRDLDSHMMKNTEWGAVAYLSHSKYGIGYEVNVNNNSIYKTGYSALPSTDQLTTPGTSGDGDTYNRAYNTEIGYLASTTGNITGIYDMSGSAFEYTSAYISGKLGSSGFTTTTISDYDSKYFDVYNSSSATNTHQYGILGDATWEMGPFKHYLDGDNGSRYHNNWYADFAYFVESSNPWFIRGGSYGFGALTGLFSFNKHTGASQNNCCSRLVLSPQK